MLTPASKDHLNEKTILVMCVFLWPKARPLLWGSVNLILQSVGQKRLPT